jgi:hypothetical protein
MGCLFVLLGAIGGLAASSCSDCVDAPGVCPPRLECVDGFLQTGAASCENGRWVCERVACVSDAGACDGVCSDSGLD